MQSLGLCRWSMRMKSRFLPWQPELVFSGNSYYAVDNLSGDLLNQRDVWDAVADNGFPSVIPMLWSTLHFMIPMLTLLLLVMWSHLKWELSGASVSVPLSEFQSSKSFVAPACRQRALRMLCSS